MVETSSRGSEEGEAKKDENEDSYPDDGQMRELEKVLENEKNTAEEDWNFLDFFYILFVQIWVNPYKLRYTLKVLKTVR